MMVEEGGKPPLWLSSSSSSVRDGPNHHPKTPLGIRHLPFYSICTWVRGFFLGVLLAIVRRRDGRRKSVMTYTHTHTPRGCGEGTVLWQTLKYNNNKRDVIARITFINTKNPSSPKMDLETIKKSQLNSGKYTPTDKKQCLIDCRCAETLPSSSYSSSRSELGFKILNIRSRKPKHVARFSLVRCRCQFFTNDVNNTLLKKNNFQINFLVELWIPKPKHRGLTEV